MHKVQDSHRPPHPAALPASTDAAAPRAIPPPTPNLEFFSGYWPDTSLPAKSEPPTDEEKQRSRLPTHQQTHVRVGNGSQLPPEYRQNLITAFVKLVAYDFGCNVSFPRTEPRLHLTPSPRASPEPTPPPSYFNSSATFIYRMPVERSSARAGIVEGPVAAVSARATTTFATPADETLDLAREIVAILLTAQQRARDGKTERRFGDGEWWTMRPRWGGGPGGPIGKEADTAEGAASAPDADGAEKSPPAQTEDERAAVKMANEVKRQIGGIANRTPNPAKRPKKSKEGSLMAIYDAYRRMTPPSGTWDRRARYSAIGKVQGEAYDDVFLISALNHHICVVRAKVPEDLLVVLEGEEKGSWERLEVRRSRWWDLYLKEDRVEAMNVVWGVMSWLMRKVEHPKEKAAVQLVEKMDLSC
ncbi:hypothetical protein PZA11_005065 [Diplocarpon coronariae]